MAAQRGNFWARAWRPVHADSPATRPAEPDWAEMGTAFGLDASLVTPSGQPQRQAAAPASGDAASTAENLWAANRLNGRSVI